MALGSHARAALLAGFAVFAFTSCATTTSPPGDGNVHRRAERTLIGQAEALASRFRQLTGDELVVGALLSLPGVPPTVGLQPDNGAERHFGDFAVTVYPTRQIAATFMLSANEGPSNDEGIIWQKQYEPVSWTAIKNYRNIQLVWQADEPMVDERWRQLDAVMRHATHAA